MIEIVRPTDGAMIRDNTPTIRGNTEPGASVEVFVDGDLVGTVTADGTGAWTIDVTATLTDGPHTMRAVATDAGGNTATDNGGFIIDRSTRVDFQQPGTDGPIGDTTPELSGTGEPGASVAVTIDGTLVGTATVDAEGNWTLQVPAALADGMHAVSITATNDVGGTASDTGTFVIDLDAPALEIRNHGGHHADHHRQRAAWVDRCGLSRWRLPRNRDHQPRWHVDLAGHDGAHRGCPHGLRHDDECRWQQRHRPA